MSPCPLHHGSASPTPDLLSVSDMTGLGRGPQSFSLTISESSMPSGLSLADTPGSNLLKGPKEPMSEGEL